MGDPVVVPTSSLVYPHRAGPVFRRTMKVTSILLAHLLLLSMPSVFALGQDTPHNQGQVPRGRGADPRGDRGGWGGGILGRGVLGTVSEIKPDHFMVKTENGELYTVFYSVNTRIMKGGSGFRRGPDGEFQPPANPPTPIKAADIRVGDAIGASGEIDLKAKTVGAVVIMQIDAERAKEMREMQANYGKTWLIGKVASINDVKVTLEGGPDNATHTFVADENTTFRKRREPITLGDIQVGDMVRTEGSMKDGVFLATSVVVMPAAPPRDDGAAPPQ